MKLYKPEPPKPVVHCWIRRDGYKSESLTFHECTQAEAHAFITKALSTFDYHKSKKKTVIAIRSKTGHNGKYSGYMNAVVQGSTPKEVHDFLINAINAKS